MEFLIEHLEQKGYKIEICGDTCLAYGKDILFRFTWDGVDVAYYAAFDKWSNSKLNRELLPLPYTDEQLDEFWKSVNFFTKA